MVVMTVRTICLAASLLMTAPFLHAADGVHLTYHWHLHQPIFDAVFDKADRVTVYQSGVRNSINRLRGLPDAEASIIKRRQHCTR